MIKLALTILVTIVITVYSTPYIRDIIDPFYLSRDFCESQGASLLLHSADIVLCFERNGIQASKYICIGSGNPKEYCEIQEYYQLLELGKLNQDKVEVK